MRLSDYLSKDFLVNNCVDNISRENQVLYNPKKGFKFTKQLIEFDPNIKWIPIINMSSQQIADLMKTSKVYVDFGNHPGKDRIPREAAVCGCCIITGKRGAAANPIDVPIPDNYKYEETQIPAIIKTINKIFVDYPRYREDFCLYVEEIKKEEQVFEEEIKDFFVNREFENIVHSRLFQIKQRVFRNVVYMMKFSFAKH